MTQTHENRRVAIACGGTGGHILPGMAIGDELRARGLDVIVLLSGLEAAVHSERAREAGLVPRAVPAVRLPACRLGYPRFGLAFARCVVRTLCELRKYRCDVVLGMGSFAAAPACLAALLRRTPLVLHEGNAVPGLTNRLFARRARCLATSLPLADGGRVSCPTRFTGLPVRQRILDGLAAGPVGPDDYTRRQLKPGVRTILVFGGSLGAAALNQTVPAAIAELAEQETVQVVHLTGRGNSAVAEVEAAYADTRVIAARVQARDEAMETLYRLADMVVCRAGASTLTELSFAEKSAVLVPLPSAADDHQSANARVLAGDYPFHVLPEAELTPASLANLLRQPPPSAPENQRAFRPNPAAAAAVADLVITRPER